ncbi:glycine oxidase [Neorhizobium huautlense]|uniref:Glycine oxidase n=1 Tax=Neorhizobium huautlense TaxID=67774 RepID=A0ABT9PX60_9HYPH|nr:FAD-dependent oxidoreductase [Neorhizobium huautlense]MDP9839007.1 glycine oxidase [Neorhizobium huautlense]
MGKADNPAGASGQSSADLLIIGGGVMGLWAAVKAERLGIDTLLVDAGGLGQGASHGLIGALMSHLPDKWSDKKQFQFDALVALEDEVARLEGETGVSCGYRRCGRLIPLPKPHLADIARGHSQDAESRWLAGDRKFHWHVMEETPNPEWLNASIGEAGVVLDTLAGRASPRRFGSALAAALKQAKHVRIIENNGVVRLNGREAVLADGSIIAFGHAIVANGYQAFPLLESLGSPMPRPLGMPVKGQSALLKADVDIDLPVIFLKGLYVVPHEGGTVAIGSTSEEEFDAPFATDEKLEALIERARKMSPMLADAPVVERWAGLRPKAIDRDPMIGRHPDHPHILALAGGFKVSFGLAHKLADAVLDALAGRSMAVPPSFLLENHLTVARASV